MFDDNTLSRHHGDDGILAMFREWCGLRRRFSSAYDGDDNPVLDEADAIEAKLFAIPATGAAGLAVKVYLLIFRDDDCLREADDAGLSYKLENWWPEKAAALRDVIKFIPEIDGLAAPYLASAAAATVLPSDADNLTALITEEACLRKAAVNEREQLESREKQKKNAKVPNDKLYRLRARIDALEQRAAALSARVKAVVPRTLDDLTALLEFASGHENNDILKNAVTALREIQARGPQL